MGVSPTPDLVTWLQADAGLETLAPGGVWEDPAPDISEIFVGLALVGSTADRCGGGGYVLECVYEVSGVAEVQGAANITGCRAVQERVHELVHAQPVTLAGWRSTTPHFLGLVERTQPEPLTGRRWIIRGGRYRWVLEPM